MTAFDASEIYNKKILLIRICCISWIVAKALSWKAWTGNRLLPIIPTSDFIPELPNGIHITLFIVSLAVLSLIAVFPNKNILFAIVLCTEILSCLLDKMRFQPWEYQYLLTLIFIIACRKEKDGLRFLQLLSFLICATYIFSGIHKIGGSFLYVVWDTMVLKQFLGLSNAAISNPFLHYSGLILAVIECGAGLVLLFSKSKLLAVYTLVFMHLLILFVLSPLGLNYNSIVWPWNVAMTGIVWVLFVDKPVSIDRKFFNNKLNIAVVILVGFCPILNFAGYWDDYLSFNLYSGNNKKLMICIDNPKRYLELGRYFIRRDRHGICDGSKTINADKWALTEINLPVYPDEPTFKAFKSAFDKKFPDAQSTFIMYWYPYGNAERKEIR